MTSPILLLGDARGPTMRGARAATGSIAATSSESVTVTFPEPFPNTDYTVVATVEGAETGDGLLVRRITSLTEAGCVVHINNAALGTRSGTIHVLAIGD